MKSKEKHSPRLRESRSFGILAALAAAAAGIFILILPRVQALRPGGELDAVAARAELARVESAVRAAQARAQSVASYGTESAADRLAALLPDAPDVPELIRGIDAAARAAGVELTTLAVTVRPQSKGAANAAIPVDIALAGSEVRYDELKKFVGALENSLRLIDIQSLAYQPDALSLSVKAAAYVLNSAASPAGAFDERALSGDAFAALKALTAPRALPTPSGGRLNPFATSTLTP